MLYLWLKSFHLIAMVCWFAGIFYLPRLYVYHTDIKDKESQIRFQIMERRLYYGIMTPSAIVTLGLGLGLFSLNPSYYLQARWFHMKVALLFLLFMYHLYCGHLRKCFEQNKNNHSSTFFRWLNECPVLLLMSIVILAVLKPF